MFYTLTSDWQVINMAHYQTIDNPKQSFDCMFMIRLAIFFARVFVESYHFVYRVLRNKKRTKTVQVFRFGRMDMMYWFQAFWYPQLLVILTQWQF